jgi:hypothetical protein
MRKSKSTRARAPFSELDQGRGAEGSCRPAGCGRSRLPLLALSAHLFRTFTLLSLALEIHSPLTDRFTSPQRHFRLRLVVFTPVQQLDGRLTPTKPYRVRSRFVVVSARASGPHSRPLPHLERWQPWTSNNHNTHRLPLTLALDPSLLSRITSDCFVCCVAARNQTPWLRTSRASRSRSHATSSSPTTTQTHHRHLPDLRPP